MARSQMTNGFFPIPLSHFGQHHPIQRGAASSNAALYALLGNDNTQWAQDSPILLMGPTPVNINQGYFQTPAGGGSSADIYLAWRGLWGQDSRLALRCNALVRNSDGSTGGTVRFRAEDAGNNLDLTVTTGMTTWSWVTGTVTVNGSGATPPIVAERDTVTLRAWRTAGSGRIQVRAYSIWLEPHSGDLPAGKQDSGSWPHDLDEVAADQCLPVRVMRRLRENLNWKVWGYGCRRPFAGACVPMLDDGSAITGSDTYLANNSAQWRAVGAPMPFPRQHLKDKLVYNLYGQRAGASGKVRLRNMSMGQAGTEHDLPASPTVTTQSDWLSDELAVRPLPMNVHPADAEFDWIQAEVLGDGSANYAWLWAAILQEQEG